MKRTVLLTTALTGLLSIIALYGCKDDEYGYPPTYGVVYMEEAEAHLGDSITLKVEIIDPGYGSYKATYVWKVDGSTVLKQTVIDPNASQPSMKYLPTSAGQHTASFSATHNMAVSTEAGQIYSTASSKTGKFTIRN